MSDKDVDGTAATGRRVFLARTAACAGGLLCLGCAHALAAEQQAATGVPAQPHKFDADAKMTFRQVYDFAFTRSYIPVLKSLGQAIGREKFVPMLQAAASEAAAEAVKNSAPAAPNNTLAAFLPRDTEYPWSHVLTLQWIEKAERTAEIRVTECLWAATFRAAGAGDIGYACCCHPDFAVATAFNPKMRMLRTKTLMQGNDCCNHRWVVDA